MYINIQVLEINRTHRSTPPMGSTVSRPFALYCAPTQCAARALVRPAQRAAQLLPAVKHSRVKTTTEQAADNEFAIARHE